MVEFSIALVIIFLFLDVIVVIALLLCKDPISDIFNNDLLILHLFPIGLIVFLYILFIIFRVQCSYWLHREESYLDVRLDHVLGNVSIRNTDVCYMTDDWFVIPGKAYAFHINFITDMGKFKYHTYRFCGYDGRLYTADGGTWKIYNISNTEYKKLRKWFRQGKNKSKEIE